MRSVKLVAFVVSALALMLAVQGCQLLLIPAAYGLGKLQEKQAVKTALATAPEVGHPVATKSVENVPAKGSRGTQFRMASFAPEQMCFGFVNDSSPEQVQQGTYRLLSFRSPEEPMDKVPVLGNGIATIVNSQRELRPVTRKRTETIRDRTGQVIATVDKQVTELEPFYTTEANVCFAQPAIITADTRFVMLQANREVVAWRLRAN
jgi:hypothetical protein